MLPTGGLIGQSQGMERGRSGLRPPPKSQSAVTFVEARLSALRTHLRVLAVAVVPGALAIFPSRAVAVSCAGEEADK